MAWNTTFDVSEFEAAAGGFLRADPVRNTTLLSITATVLTHGADAYGDAPPKFGWYREPGEPVRAAFLRTPPHPAVVGDLPVGAVESLVEVLAEAPGVSGPAESVKAFGRAWQVATGRVPEVAANRRLYRLAELTPPRLMPDGKARVAGVADRELLIDWHAAFAEQASMRSPALGRVVDSKVRDGDLMLWEVDGVPVSMAGITEPLAGVARVAPVYTPPERRGRSYAGAVTTAISRRALDAGHEVVLFTDLANPTSNALYQRLGYREVGDWLELELETGS